MVNRNAFRASLFSPAFIAALLLVAPQTHAAMQTFEKEYTYTASELDSKSSCRAIALEQVKRILLQELGVYVESVFNDKASTDGRTKDEVRCEITTLSAGVASTEVVEEKWDGTTYWLKARHDKPGERVQYGIVVSGVLELAFRLVVVGTTGFILLRGLKGRGLLLAAGAATTG